MEKVLIVGLGEVGSAIYTVFKNSGLFKVYGYDIDMSRTIDSIESIEKPIDYLHIAIPYTRDFVDIVKHYIEMFKPRITVIHSTVAIGTTRAIYRSSGVVTAYSPVRGKHPNMVKHVMFWSKWVSALPEGSVEECANHLSKAGFRVRIYRGSPESLELAKLWETVYRAIMITSWQELHRIARKFGVDIGVVTEFVGEVHEVLKDRPIYFPGYIGGHCLIPNTKILSSQYPSKLFEFVLESNERRLKELEDEDIRREVEYLKKIAMKYMNVDYYEGRID
jgi:UDP-N-acetyl-D-mannosaminuronate dehydrogenase